jgi:hypothetical protein
MKLYMCRTVPLSITRSYPLYIQQWYMSRRSADSFRAVHRPVWHIPLLVDFIIKKCKRIFTHFCIQGRRAFEMQCSEVLSNWRYLGKIWWRWNEETRNMKWHRLQERFLLTTKITFFCSSVHASWINFIKMFQQDDTFLYSILFPANSSTCFRPVILQF